MLKNINIQVRGFILFLALVITFAFFCNLFNVAQYFIKGYQNSNPEKYNGNIIQDSAQFGDLVGGLLGTVIAAIGTGILIYTFYKQQTNFRKERFEDRFFELMKIYRDNVVEMNIGDKVVGRKCFMFMFKEFKFIYYVSKIIFEKDKIKYTPELNLGNYSAKDIDNKISDIAFEIFFFGIGEESEKIFKSDSTSEFYRHIKKELENYQEIYLWSKAELKCLSSHDVFSGTIDELKALNLFYEFETKYYPFDGHISRLGHYYRQLFQIVRYVVQQEDILLNKKEVLEHLKTLRTQMSNHEQLLLYYNGMCEIGLKWNGDDKVQHKNYFKEYQMIHNIPIPLANVGHLPKDAYSKQELDTYDIFEWEIKNEN